MALSCRVLVPPSILMRVQVVLGDIIRAELCQKALESTFFGNFSQCNNGYRYILTSAQFDSSEPTARTWGTAWQVLGFHTDCKHGVGSVSHDTGAEFALVASLMMGTELFDHDDWKVERMKLQDERDRYAPPSQKVNSRHDLYSPHVVQTKCSQRYWGVHLP